MSKEEIGVSMFVYYIWQARLYLYSPICNNGVYNICHIYTSIYIYISYSGTNQFGRSTP